MVCPWLLLRQWYRKKLANFTVDLFQLDHRCIHEPLCGGKSAATILFMFIERGGQFMGLLHHFTSC